MSFIIQWIDVIWLILAVLVTQKGQRIVAGASVAACMLMMRMQVEFLASIGYQKGLVGLMDSHVFSRGIIVYSICYILYFLLALFSPQAKGSIMMAASITMFFAAFFVSSLIMVL